MKLTEYLPMALSSLISNPETGEWYPLGDCLIKLREKASHEKMRYTVVMPREGSTLYTYYHVVGDQIIGAPLSEGGPKNLIAMHADMDFETKFEGYAELRLYVD